MTKHLALNLGNITQKVLFFGGPCSNLQATRALLDAASRESVSMDHVICTGDLVAYCADPVSTVVAIRAAGVHVVLGNCEQSFGNAAEDCDCGFEESSSCDVLAKTWYSYASSLLDAETRRWLRTRPQQIRFTMDNREIAVVHGGVESINEFIFPATNPTRIEAQLNAAAVDAVVAGHSGVPFTKRVGSRLWHNAGVIGIPANDGTRRVWYSLFEPTPNGIEISHRTLCYDADKAAGRMREVGLPDAYARTLVTGIWPADDIMPAQDRTNRGRPLDLGSLRW